MGSDPDPESVRQLIWHVVTMLALRRFGDVQAAFDDDVQITVDGIDSLQDVGLDVLTRSLRMLLLSMPDYTVQVRDLSPHDDAWRLQLQVQGTRRGPLFDQLPTGQRMTIDLRADLWCTGPRISKVRIALTGAAAAEPDAPPEPLPVDHERQQAHETAVRAFVQRVNDGDFDGAFALMHPQLVSDTVAWGRVEGRDRIRTLMEQTSAAYDYLRVEVEQVQHLTADSMAARLVLHGADGSALAYVDVYRFDADGLIVAVDSSNDPH